MKDLNIIIAGVGGQGVLFLTRLLGETAIRMKKRVISSEVRGMSQMLGPVSSMTRIGDHMSADFEQADVILSMEPLEALRYSHMLTDDGVIITSDNSVMMKGYPNDLFDRLKARKSSIIKTKTLSKDNVIIFGVFCRKFGIPSEIAENTIKGFKDSEKNLAAFKTGFSYEV